MTAHPAHDRYIRLMHLWDRFNTAASTASQIAGLRQIFSQTVINRLCQAGLQQSDLCDKMFSRHIILLSDTSSVENIFDGDMYSGEKLVFLTNLTSWCSESIDVIMNVMLPT